MSPLTAKLLEQLQKAPCHSEDAAFTEALRLWRFAGCPDVPPKEGCFGEWLKRARRSRGVTLEGLSTPLKMNINGLSRIENSLYEITAREWSLLCSELALTPEEKAKGEELLRVEFRRGGA